MTFTQQLQSQILELQDNVNGKDLELQILNNELTDALSPAIYISEMQGIILKMMMDNTEFVRKNGMTPKAKESRERVLRLMELTSKLDGISTVNTNLKLINKEIHGRYQLLRIKNMELNKQISIIQQVDSF